MYSCLALPCSCCSLNQMILLLPGGIFLKAFLGSSYMLSQLFSCCAKRLCQCLWMGNLLVSQVLLEIPILMCYSLTCLFHHVSCLVALSLTAIALICYYWVISQVTFSFSALGLVAYPISLAHIFKPLHLYSFTTLLTLECTGSLLPWSQ